MLPVGVRDGYEKDERRVRDCQSCSRWVPEAGGELLGAVDGAVLATGAAEGYAEVGEVALEVFVDALADYGFGVVEECGHSVFALQEFYDGAVFAGIGLVLGVAPGVGQRAAVEDVSAAVAGRVLGESLLVAEAANGDGEGGWFGGLRDRNYGRYLSCCICLDY